MLALFRKKQTVSEQLIKAWKLIVKLLSIRVVQIFFLILLFLIVAPIGAFILMKPKIQHDINYGVTFSKKYSEEVGQNWKETYIKILDDLNVKNLRLVAYWDDIERENGTYDFSDIEWQLIEADKRDLNVILTMGRKVPRYPECFEPEWWKQMEEAQRDQELYEYVEVATKALMNHQSIKMWQVENEPFWEFGVCLPIKRPVVEKEIQLVRDIDPSRPILVQDSGEGGIWRYTFELGDYLGISMYRKIWYDFWGIFLGESIYFQYPLAHWSYKIKANMLGIPMDKIIITELQGEPWGPGPNHLLSEDEKNMSMSRNDFLSTISYAQKSGFKNLYLWGAEWWLFEKEVNGNSFYWDTAKALFN